MIKIAFLTNNLDIGGIERAILNYLKYIDKSKYEITLFLDQGEGIYYNEVDKQVEIVSFNMSKSKNIIWRKAINFAKLLYFSLKYYHKFAFAASFTTTVKSNTILAKRFSKNNAIWYHGDYFDNSVQAGKFLRYSHSLSYKKVVFVSECIKNKYLRYTDSKQELFVINNPIDYLDMLAKSKIDLNLKKKKLTLLNVGRQEEYAKRLSYLLMVTARLLKEGYDFELWLVGSGPDELKYYQMIEKLKIENNVIMFGKQNNVYPFYKQADAVVLTSFMEGNPVVYLEAKVMNKPLVSTNVSDAAKELKGYGIVCNCDQEDIYRAIKTFLDSGYRIEQPFDPASYNDEVMKKLYEVISL
ncbi:MAG: glycosyltransferase [Erysipelotrichia bacterium]|nr:glycosyltransferase [Erysipelotrichia bacterium]